MIANTRLAVLTVLSALLHDDPRDERGDVPGWVMITLMSAVLVVGILAIAAPALQDMFTQAIDSVTSAG